MSLASHLERLTGLPGVRAIIVAGREGLVIELAPRAAEEPEALAAYGVSALNAASALGASTKRTALMGVILEYGDILISVEPLGEMAATVTCLENAAALVPLRQMLHQMRGDLLADLDLR